MGLDRAVPPTDKFATELRARMKRRGLSHRALAKAAGIHAKSIYMWTNAKNLPEHTYVVILAEVLMAPRLVEISLEARTGECEVCGKPTLAMRSTVKPNRFCSKRCQNTNKYRRLTKLRADRRYAALHRLKEVHAAVAEFCRSCEPEGICRNAAGTETEMCVFQRTGLSPFKFIPLSNVTPFRRTA